MVFVLLLASQPTDELTLLFNLELESRLGSLDGLQAVPLLELQTPQPLYGVVSALELSFGGCQVLGE